jgi:hypothetical protein
MEEAGMPEAVFLERFASEMMILDEDSIGDRSPAGLAEARARRRVWASQLLDPHLSGHSLYPWLAVGLRRVFPNGISADAWEALMHRYFEWRKTHREVLVAVPVNEAILLPPPPQGSQPLLMRYLHDHKLHKPALEHALWALLAGFGGMALLMCAGALAGQPDVPPVVQWALWLCYPVVVCFGSVQLAVFAQQARLRYPGHPFFAPSPSAFLRDHGPAAFAAWWLMWTTAACACWPWMAWAFVRENVNAHKHP